LAITPAEAESHPAEAGVFYLRRCDMKFDIYKGSEKDMQESDGELNLTKCNRTQVKEFCKGLKIDFEKIITGDYINGFWLEEAI